MSVLVTSSGSLKVPLKAVAGNTYDATTGTFTLGTGVGDGDDIATTSFATGPGQFGTFSVLISHPTTMTDFQVRLAWEVMEAGGSVIDSGEGPAVTVPAIDRPPPGPTGEELLSVTFPAAPVGAATRKVILRAASDPPAVAPTVKRTNLYTDPRSSDVARWFGRNSWSVALVTTLSPPPVPGLTLGVYAQCTSAGAVTLAGLNLYGSPHDAAPPATGFPVTAGDVLTISGYVYSTKAGTVQVDAKAFLGAAWVGSRWSGTGVAVAARVWSRVKLTYTVPATANRLCMSWTMPASTTWAVADRIYLAAVQIEKNAPTPDEYFDGTNIGFNPLPGYVAWSGAPDASTSLLYNDVNQTRKATVSGDLLATQAGAEALLGASLERNLRRSVAEIFNSSTARIAAGTPSLLSGSLTFLCNTWAQAKTLDALHQTVGTVTLGGPDSSDLAGLRYVSIETNQLTAEEATPGLPSKWLVQVQIREQP